MFWTRVWEMLTAWRRPKRQIAIELTPEEQLAIRFLTEFGRGAEEDIFREAATRRWTEPHMITTALFNLQVKGIVRLVNRGEGPLYYPTDRAYAIRDLLPPEATSSLLIYLTVPVLPTQRPEQRRGP